MFFLLRKMRPENPRVVRGRHLCACKMALRLRQGRPRGLAPGPESRLGAWIITVYFYQKRGAGPVNNEGEAGQSAFCYGDF